MRAIRGRLGEQLARDGRAAPAQSATKCPMMPLTEDAHAGFETTERRDAALLE